MPSLGQIQLLHEPTGPGVRIDTGVKQGDEVSMYYDPLIAKLSLHSADREAAIDRAIAALREYAVLGVTTNVAYLIAVLDHPAFRAGETHTGFIREHMTNWAPERESDARMALIATALQEYRSLGSGGGIGGTNGANRGSQPLHTPWNSLGRFRLQGLD